MANTWGCFNTLERVSIQIVLVIFMPSCCSYCHCSTGSDSHTVVLSKPASYFPALPVIIREHAYQSFMVVSRYGESTAVVRLQYVSGCGKSKIKVRRKYTGCKRYIPLKYGKSKVKCGKSTVLYGNFFWRQLYVC